VTQDLITISPSGLNCPERDIFIDPWQPAAKVVIIPGQGDHLIAVSQNDPAAPETGEILRLRLGSDVPIQKLPCGQSISMNGVVLSLH